MEPTTHHPARRLALGVTLTSGLIVLAAVAATLVSARKRWDKWAGGRRSVLLGRCCPW